MLDILPSNTEAAVYFVAVLIVSAVALAFVALAASESSRAERAEEELRQLRAEAAGPIVVTVTTSAATREAFAALGLRDTSLDLIEKWS